MAKVILKQGRAKPLWHGHPWVYAQAIRQVDGEVESGQIVEVYDDRKQFIGKGPMTPGSAIAVRLLGREQSLSVGREWVFSKLESALALRKRMGLPSAETDCFRWVNSEGDGLSGLVVDVYGSAVAVQFTASGMFKMAQWVFDGVAKLLDPKVIVEVSPGSFAEKEGITVQPRLIKGDSAQVSCLENGVRYSVDILAGQKTGLYLDQRENHRLVGDLASGMRVIDLYAYHGGFALNAARGGAKEVIAVDGSARAVETISKNAKENGLKVEAVEADAFRYLAQLPKGSADLVVVDPPKFARSRRELDAALKGYRKLHRLAIAALAEGGILASAICSQLVSLEDLERIIGNAAVDSGRAARVFNVRGAGPDHTRPPTFAEGDYLKFVVCEMS